MVRIRVTTCLENLEMSGNFTTDRECGGIEVREMSGKSRGKILSEKMLDMGDHNVDKSFMK